MKNQFQSTLLLMAIMLLIISLAGNYFQHTLRKPVIETVFETDTLVRIDTIFHTVTQQVTIDRPVPVYIDTTTNIRTYRDTITHPFGTIQREELILGEILKQDLTLDVKIPEIFNTITITNSTTQTIRKPLLFVTGGLRYNHSGSRLVPTVGLFGIAARHRLALGANIGLDGTVGVNLGVRIGR